MIKLEIEGEVPEPERTVKLTFRRHQNALQIKGVEQQAFLVAECANLNTQVYPLKVDGITKTVEIRRSDFEALGFTVVVK